MVLEGIHASQQCTEFIGTISLKGREDGPFEELGMHQTEVWDEGKKEEREEGRDGGKGRRGEWML